MKYHIRAPEEPYPDAAIQHTACSRVVAGTYIWDARYFGSVHPAERCRICWEKLASGKMGKWVDVVRGVYAETTGQVD